MTWQFTLTGLLIGILVGLTGMGGGSLMTPILILLFGFNAKVAVGTDILHGAIFKSFGAVRCRQLGTVHARLAFWMFLGSGPMSLAGVMAASSLGKGAQGAESYAVGAALILGGLGLVAKTFIKRGVQPSDAPFLLERRDKILATTIGAVFGFIVGLTSVGSGTSFGLVMVMIFPLTIPKIVGTDIFHAAALLWVASFGHLVRGNVNLHATAWLLIGSIPGILLASKLPLHIPDRPLRLGLAAVLGLSGLKLVNFPEATYVLGVGVVLTLSALGWWAFAAMRAPRAVTARVYD